VKHNVYLLLAIALNVLFFELWFGARTNNPRLALIPTAPPTAPHRAPNRTAHQTAPPDKGFTATQYIAVVLASISVIVYSATLFRPAAAPGRRFGLRTVAVFGASIMAGSAFSQMLSFVLIIVITNDLDWGKPEWGGMNSGADLEQQAAPCEVNGVPVGIYFPSCCTERQMPSMFGDTYSRFLATALAPC